MSGKKPNGGKATPQQVAAAVLKYRPMHSTKKPPER